MHLFLSKMSSSFNDPTTFNTQITYGTRFYKIVQPTNSNFEFRIAVDELLITTNVSLAGIFFMNNIGLDWTKITNIVAADRTSMIQAIEALAGNQAVTVSGPVSISGTVPVSFSGTIPVIITPSTTGNFYTLLTTANSAALAPALAIKVTSASPTAKVVLSSISSGSTASIGSGIGVQIVLTKNPTVTGGTYANYSTSIVQTNTTLTGSSGGVDFIGFIYKQSLGVVDLTPLNLTFLNNDIIVIGVSNNGILGSTGVQLNFTQNT